MSAERPLNQIEAQQHKYRDNSALIESIKSGEIIEEDPAIKELAITLNSFPNPERACHRTNQACEGHLSRYRTLYELKDEKPCPEDKRFVTEASISIRAVGNDTESQKAYREAIADAADALAPFVGFEQQGETIFIVIDRLAIKRELGLIPPNASPDEALLAPLPIEKAKRLKEKIDEVWGQLNAQIRDSHR